MNGYNFTERVRKVLALAREEAAVLRHEHVGTEHILLGLIRGGGGVGHAMLQHLTGDADAVRDRLLERLTQGSGRPAAVLDLPYTSKAKKSLEYAMAEARDFKHSYVGTEHLLLGLMRETSGIASQVLSESGADIGSARAEMLRMLGPEGPNGNAEPLIGEVRDEVLIPIQRCAECNVDMDRGHLVGRRLRLGSPMTWVPGVPVRNAWFGTSQDCVAAFRCPKCGVLRLIAPPG